MPEVIEALKSMRDAELSTWIVVVLILIAYAGYHYWRYEASEKAQTEKRFRQLELVRQLTELEAQNTDSLSAERKATRSKYLDATWSVIAIESSKEPGASNLTTWRIQAGLLFKGAIAGSVYPVVVGIVAILRGQPTSMDSLATILWIFACLTLLSGIPMALASLKKQWNWADAAMLGIPGGMLISLAGAQLLSLWLKLSVIFLNAK